VTNNPIPDIPRWWAKASVPKEAIMVAALKSTARGVLL
jgi:hypothetical protein